MYRDYKGTIIFLGDHKVKITINGSSYTYDLQTGLEVKTADNLNTNVKNPLMRRVFYYMVSLIILNLRVNRFGNTVIVSF